MTILCHILNYPYCKKCNTTLFTTHCQKHLNMDNIVTKPSNVEALGAKIKALERELKQLTFNHSLAANTLELARNADLENEEIINSAGADLHRLTTRIAEAQGKINTLNDQKGEVTNIISQYDKYVPVPEDSNVAVNFDRMEVFKLFGSMSSDRKKTFRTFFTKIFAYGKDRNLSHANYKQIMDLLLDGDMHEQFMRIRERPLQIIVKYLICQFDKAEQDPADIFNQIDNFTRRPNERINDCMIRLDNLLYIAAKILQQEERPHYIEHTLRSKIMQLIGPKTKHEVQRYIRINLKKGYQITSKEMISMASEAEIQFQEIPYEGLKPQGTVQSLMAQINEVSHDCYGSEDADHDDINDQEVAMIAALDVKELSKSHARDARHHTKSPFGHRNSNDPRTRRRIEQHNQWSNARQNSYKRQMEDYPTTGTQPRNQVDKEAAQMSRPMHKDQSDNIDMLKSTIAKLQSDQEQLMKKQADAQQARSFNRTPTFNRTPNGSRPTTPTDWRPYEYTSHSRDRSSYPPKSPHYDRKDYNSQNGKAVHWKSRPILGLHVPHDYVERGNRLCLKCGGKNYVSDEGIPKVQFSNEHWTGSCPRYRTYFNQKCSICLSHDTTAFHPEKECMRLPATKN